MRHMLLAACIFAGASVVHAAEPAAPPAAPPAGDAMAKLLAADTNKDGKWSREEWKAAGRKDRGFTFMDTDKDGFLSPAELKAGMEKAKARGLAQ